LSNLFYGFIENVPMSRRLPAWNVLRGQDFLTTRQPIRDKRQPSLEQGLCDREPRLGASDRVRVDEGLEYPAEQLVRGIEVSLD
jgi:hypothetical protein